MQLQEKKRLVDEMVLLEQDASRLLKKRPFTHKDGLRLKEVLTRIRVNYVALGREDAKPALDDLNKALLPLLALMLAMRGVLPSMVMPAGAIAMLSAINASFTNLILMYPLISLSQVGRGGYELPRESAFVAAKPLPMPMPVMSMAAMV